MAASAWIVHDDIKAHVLNKEIDLEADDIYCSLFLTGTNAHTSSVVLLASATNPTATANGYAPFLLTGKAVSTATTVTKFDCNDVAWTAASGDISGAVAVLWDDTAAVVVDPIICSSELNDGVGDNITATDTNDFTIAMNAGGVFTLT